MIRRRLLSELGTEEVEMEVFVEEVLGSGTIKNGSSSGFYDTGVTVGDLRKYEMIYLAIRGSINTALWHGFMIKNGAERLTYANGAGSCLLAKWINREKNILNPIRGFCGNSAYIKTIGESMKTKNAAAGYIFNGTASNIGYFIEVNAEDTEPIIMYFNSDTTIDYSWEIIGVTKK